MENILSPNTVTAVRLGDGWHEGVTDFRMWANLYDHDPPIAGASWMEPNSCKFSCPLTAILAIREGIPADVVHAALEPRPGRPDYKLETAIEWLEVALSDGQPHPTKFIRGDAKAAANISAETLERAFKALGAKSIRMRGCWCWQLEPLNAVAEDFLQQSNLIQVEGSD